MTRRSSRDTEYVLVRDRIPKKSTHYYDADDDNELQTTRRIVRSKPTKEQRIKYVTTDENESDHRRQRIAEPSDRRLKIRHTTNGEQVVLDEDNNILKIIRTARSPTPPYVENRRGKSQLREPQTLYYETSDGHILARVPNAHPKARGDFVYAEDQPTKVLRKVILDPRTGDRETVYQKTQPRKQIQQKFIVRKHAAEIPVDSDDEYDQQQPQYVQVVQRRTVPTQVETKQEAPVKYMMVRRKVDSEPVYTTRSSNPTIKTNRRIVYETPTKKSSNTYVYSTDGKYYK